VSLDQIGGVLLVTTQCSCMKPGQGLGDISLSMVRYLDLQIEEREKCFNRFLLRVEAQDDLRVMEATIRTTFRDYNMSMGQVHSSEMS
jgi:hypothetical protein